MNANRAHHPPASPPTPHDIEGLYRDYGAAVSRWASQLARSSTDAEDIAQEVFLVAHRRRADLPALRNPGAWLYRIAENVARHLWRRRHRSRLTTVAGLADLPDKNPTPLELLEHQRLLDHLDRAMSTLCERDQRLLLLSDLRQAPASRDATLRRIKPETLRVRRHRARAQIARQLRELG